MHKFLMAVAVSGAALGSVDAHAAPVRGVAPGSVQLAEWDGHGRPDWRRVQEERRHEWERRQREEAMRREHWRYEHDRRDYRGW